MKPVTIDVKETVLNIVWDDGHVSKYSNKDLREQCQCALCSGESGVFDKHYAGIKQKINDKICPTEFRPVGRYGLNIVWNDGHDAGVYTYDYLRNLCICDKCSK